MPGVVTSRIPIPAPAGRVWSSPTSAASTSGAVANQAPVSARPVAVDLAQAQAARSDWQFIPESGKTFTDAGSRMCR
jgi:hypothetical protein